MDPWSKVDYSRHIRDASMAMEKLPEVNPPSGRVSEQGILVARSSNGGGGGIEKGSGKRARSRGFP